MLRRTLIALTLTLLTGCGIQGALYLPPNAANDSYITRLRKEFNDFIGMDSIHTAPEENDTVIEVEDPKNFTINGQPLEEQEGTEESPMEGMDDETEAGSELGEGMEGAISSPVTEGTESKEENSLIMHELPVRERTPTDMDGTETE